MPNSTPQYSLSVFICVYLCVPTYYEIYQYSSSYLQVETSNFVTKMKERTPFLGIPFLKERMHSVTFYHFKEIPGSPCVRSVSACLKALFKKFMH